MSTLTINLQPGYNKVYIPFTPSNPDPAVVFPTARSVYWWSEENNSYVLVYAPTPEGHPEQQKYDIEAGKTYDVSVLEAITYTISSKASSVIPIVIGGLAIMVTLYFVNKGRK